MIYIYVFYHRSFQILILFFAFLCYFLLIIIYLKIIKILELSAPVSTGGFTLRHFFTPIKVEFCFFVTLTSKFFASVPGSISSTVFVCFAPMRVFIQVFSIGRCPTPFPTTTIVPTETVTSSSFLIICRIASVMISIIFNFSIWSPSF